MRPSTPQWSTLSRSAHASILSKHHQTTLSLFAEALIANIFNHGQAAAGSTVKIELELDGDVATLIYRDKGIPFDPHHDLPDDGRTLSPNERQVGGLGWPLILEMCERVDYLRDGNENRVTLIRRLRTMPVQTQNAHNTVGSYMKNR